MTPDQAEVVRQALSPERLQQVEAERERRAAAIEAVDLTFSPSGSAHVQRAEENAAAKVRLDKPATQAKLSRFFGGPLSPGAQARKQRAEAEREEKQRQEDKDRRKRSEAKKEAEKASKRPVGRPKKVKGPEGEGSDMQPAEPALLQSPEEFSRQHGVNWFEGGQFLQIVQAVQTCGSYQRAVDWLKRDWPDVYNAPGAWEQGAVQGLQRE